MPCIDRSPLAMNKPISLHAPRLVCLILTFITLVTYWQAKDCDFVNFDDEPFLLDNPHLRNGFSWEGIRWAFSNQIIPGTSNADWWSPVVFLSHMGDFQMHGLNASGHHLTSLLIHVLNTLLLFQFLLRMTTAGLPPSSGGGWQTGALWQSAWVAALFAVHPLNVESVVWIVNRKILLSTLFGFLMIHAYIRYVEHPTTRRYFLVLGAFTLGLMSKMTIVTLPFALLLLDYWPLKRVNLAHFSWKSWRPLIVEKCPLFALSTASCLHALSYMTRLGAISSLDHFPLRDRIANAIVSYVSYIGKAIWPHHLAVFYPHPVSSIPFWQVACAAVLVMCLSLAVILLARRFPYLIVGWFWYLGNLFPMIGLVQVGSQAMADRYVYIPLIGLLIMVVWGFADVFRWAEGKFTRTSVFSAARAAATGLLFAALMTCSWIQISHWRNSITLFEHALEVTTHNHIAHNNLGGTCMQQGEIDRAVLHFVQAIQIEPNYAYAHYNLGTALVQQGKIDQAAEQFSLALRSKSDFSKAHNNLGTLFGSQGKLDEAIAHYRAAIQVKPDYAEARYNLGTCLMRQGKFDEAATCFEAVLKLPTDPDTAKLAQRAIAKLRARREP